MLRFLAAVQSKLVATAWNMPRGHQNGPYDAFPTTRKMAPGEKTPRDAMAIPLKI